MILLACQLSLLQKASVWMESGLRSAIQKDLMVEYRLFPVFIIKIRICVQIVNTGIFAKLKDKGYLNTAPAVL